MNQSIDRVVNRKAASIEITGHLGEIAQGLVTRGGPVALVTLPCPALVTRVAFAAARGPLVSSEPVSDKALRAARLALAHLGLRDWGGELTIRRPCPPGLGAGTSTAETLGAIRAVAAAFGTRFGAELEARLCLDAEGAVDPLMHMETVLFASREARVLEVLPPMPPMTIVGGFAGPARRTDPMDQDFAEAAPLFDAVRSALVAGDAAALARAATRSAEANQEMRPNPGFEVAAELARRHGALGVSVAHTGAAVALIFPPRHGENAAAAMRAAGIRDVVTWDLGFEPQSRRTAGLL